MSNSDQAKSKLLDSMRMSKQGSTEKTPAATNSGTSKNTKPATAAKKSTASNAKAKTNSKSSASKKSVTDDFQAAERVWPD